MTIDLRIANVLLTRKCNYHCPNCLIRKDNSEDKKASYWLEVSQALNDKFGIHVNFYGGEPLLYEGFEELISGLDSTSISYSVISSSNPKPDYERLASLGLRNWTSSIDTLTDSRSVAGINSLIRFKELNVQDLMAEVVVWPNKVQDAIEVSQLLMSNDFWFNISFPSFGMMRIDTGFLKLMSKAYDSFPSIRPIWNKKDLDEIGTLRALVTPYKYLHGIKEYPFIWDNMDYLMQGYKLCNGILTSFHPNNDGKMRLCRDIRGERVTHWDALDAINNIEEFYSDWKQDFNELCLGCNWGCVFWAHGDLKHLEERL